MFARTIRMMELGLKPVWVFDGKPPDMKGGELAKRSAAKKKARKLPLLPPINRQSSPTLAVIPQAAPNHP